MPKRDDKHDMAEDYLARIKWEGEHPYMGNGEKPDIPNWNYKPIVSNRSSLSPASRVILGTVFLMIFGGLSILAIFKHESGAACIVGALAFVGLFIYIAVLDASKTKRLQ